MEDDNKEITPEKVHCPVTPYDWLRTTYRTVTVCNISDIYPVMGMVSMCSIPHHTPRQRKGWTTACKPSSSLFSCYSFQRHNLVVFRLYPHFSSSISSLFPGYGYIFPALYPHCSRGMKRPQKVGQVKHYPIIERVRYCTGLFPFNRDLILLLL